MNHFLSMLKRRWLAATVLLALYLLTWIGGWHSHAQEIEARAYRRWTDASARAQEMARLAAADGEQRRPIGLRQGGPQTGVDWCAPILPGVLICDSYYVIGPLWGRGGVKLVLYYGFGSVELLTLWGWIS